MYDDSRQAHYSTRDKTVRFAYVTNLKVFGKQGVRKVIVQLKTT
jgi:hypothetical protein